MFDLMLVRTREFKITIPALLFDPAIFVFDFAPNNDLTKFLVVEELILEQSPFIDIRFEPLAKAQFWVSTKDLFALEARHDLPRPQPVFIFHHAFVCSTLLARCLSQIDAFFSLKEPWILRRLADHKRLQGKMASGPQWRDMFCNYVSLLCKNFSTGRIPVIKATNVANNLLIDVLRFMPGSPVLYLYSDLESFLVSNLKKSSDTQLKIPALAQEFLGDCDFLQKFPKMRDLSQFTFLQICALIWLVNLYNFRDSIRQHPDARVKTLDLQDLLGDLPRSLGLVSRHFGHPPDLVESQRMIDAQVIGTNAKDQSKPYGIEQRQFEMNEIRSRHDRDLKVAI
ncbi:MAG: hypothetical protein ACRESK_01785, partial [Gammaproteobacteria bacterium]